MKKNLIVLLTLLISICTAAQINFEPGYIINNYGVKINCLIKNVAWKNSPVSLDYKKEDSSETITSKIEDISAFSVAGYNFERFVVQLDRSTNDYERMSVSKKPEFRKETVYLKKLVGGSATLYKYEDGNLIRFFTRKGTSNPEQLIYKSYRDGAQVGYNNSYKGQLYNIMKDKITDNDKYKYADYDEKSLVKLFLDYNGASDEEIKKYNDGQTNSSFNIKITPGINFSSTSNSKKDAQGTFELQSKPVFRIGIEAEWVLSFNKNKWSLFIEPNFQSYDDSDSKTYGEGLSEISNDWAVSYKYIDVPLGIRHYMFLNQKAKLFINVAYLYSFVMGDSGSNFKYGSSFSSYELKATAANSSGFLAGAGFSYKNLSIEARYNFKREIFPNYGDWSSKYKSFGIILGYKIF